MNHNLAPLVRAVRGPVMLMTVGGLAAMDHFGPYGFRQTWPVLFIIFGVMKLLEIALRPASVPPGGYGQAMPGGQQ